MGDGNHSTDTESIAAISRRATENLYREYISSFTTHENDAEAKNGHDELNNDFEDIHPENEFDPYAHAMFDSDESLLNKLSKSKYYHNGTERRSKSLGSTKNVTRIVPVVQVTLSPPQVLKEPDRRITGASKRLYDPDLYKKKEKNYARTIDSHHILYKNMQAQKEKKRKEKLSTKSLPTTRKLVEERELVGPVVTLLSVSQLLGEKPSKRRESVTMRDNLKLPLQEIEKTNLVVPEISITLPTPHQNESRPEGSLTVEELLAAADNDDEEETNIVSSPPPELQEVEEETAAQRPPSRSASPTNIKIEALKESSDIDKEAEKRELEAKREAEEKLRKAEEERAESERKRIALEDQQRREKARIEEERVEKERKRVEQLKKEEEERKREEERVEFERNRAESRARKEQEKKAAEEAERRVKEEAALLAARLEEEKKEFARKKEIEAKREAEEKAKLEQERKLAEEEAKRKQQEEESKKKHSEEETKKRELGSGKSIADIKKELKINAESAKTRSPSPKLSPTSREASKPTTPTSDSKREIDNTIHKVDEHKHKKEPFKSEELMLKLDTIREETNNELKKSKDSGKINSLKSSDEKKKHEPEEPKNELVKAFEKLRKSSEDKGEIKKGDELRKSTSLLAPVSTEHATLSAGSASMPTSPNMRKPSPRPLVVIAEVERKTMPRTFSVEELVNSIEQRGSPTSPRQRKSSQSSKDLVKAQAATAPRKSSLTATSQKTLTRSTSDLSKMQEEEEEIKQGRLWVLVEHSSQSALDNFSCQKFDGWTEFFCTLKDANFCFFEVEPIFESSPPLVHIPTNDVIALHIANTKTKEYSFAFDEKDGKQINVQFNFPFWFVLVVNPQKYVCLSVEAFTDFVKWKKLLKTSLSKTNIIQQKIWDDEGPY